MDAGNSGSVGIAAAKKWRQSNDDRAEGGVESREGVETPGPPGVPGRSFQECRESGEMRAASHVRSEGEELMPDEYTCAACGETFNKGWTDEEAHAEADAIGFPQEEREIVCDDCYKKHVEVKP